MENLLPILIPVAVVVVFLLWLVGVYNGLVGLRNKFKNAFAQIDVQLKRRYDLVPNLVEVAKKYMEHERETLEAVVKARSLAMQANSAAAASPDSPGAMQALASAEQGLVGSLGRLFALRESYPDLKANQNMMQLTEELTSTENRISFARQAYNDSVMGYNTRRETFPTNVVAGMFGFKEASLFEVSAPEERDAVKVSF